MRFGRSAMLTPLVGGHTLGANPAAPSTSASGRGILDVRFANHGFPPWSWRRADAGKPMILCSAIHTHTRSAAKYLFTHGARGTRPWAAAKRLRPRFNLG